MTWHQNPLWVERTVLKTFGRVLLGLGLCALLVTASPAEEREQIGTVHGKPVYRDQIRTEGVTLRSELWRLFASDSWQEFRQANDAQVAPTDAELAHATEYFRTALQAQLAGEYGDELRKRVNDLAQQLAAQDLAPEQREKLTQQKQALESSLNPDDRVAALSAELTLKNWKLQRCLYDKFGGGRILWQQFGLEAYDAAGKFLREREEVGDFAITDPELRAAFYEYWTNEKMHGAFLTSDPKRIRNEFLEPPWVRPIPGK